MTDTLDTLRHARHSLLIRAEKAEAERDAALHDVARLKAELANEVAIAKAFDEGQVAAGTGLPRENPYPPGNSYGVPMTTQFWDDGYDLMKMRELRARVATLEAEQEAVLATFAELPRYEPTDIERRPSTGEYLDAEDVAAALASTRSQQADK